MSTDTGTLRLSSTKVDAGPGWFSIAYLALVLAFTAFFGTYVVQNLHAPMLGAGDVNLWSYQAYYFLENLSFRPYPHLDLENDTFLYPYGTNQVFQPWGFERDYLIASCLRMFGQGPWPQFYYLGTLIVSALGVYALLRKDHGELRAAFVGFAATFGNYFALAWFPWSMHTACVHWTTLNLVADFLLLWKFWRDDPWSIRLVLLRAVLLVLALGQDLGYVAGFALSSFCLTTMFILLAHMVRSKSWRAFMPSRPGFDLGHGNSSARIHRVQIVLLLGLLTSAAFLYVPLAFQVFQNARRFPGINQSIGWAHPGRLILPIFPGFHLADQFGDEIQGLYASSPGLFFVLAGALGLVFAYRRRLLPVFAPGLVLLTLCAIYHPNTRPTLKIFPWHVFSRIGERSTVIYPTLFMLFTLAIPTSFFRSQMGKVTLSAGLALLAVEMFTAYHNTLTVRKDYFIPDVTFTRFMETVREAPGEAVFEWPFCVYAGNGVGSKLLGPFWDRKQHGIFSLRQFHTKKVMSLYHGRLDSRQIQPMLMAGWHRLFSPDSEDEHAAQRQSRDFTTEEWNFVTQGIELNDFCSIILYTDLLPTETVRRFHERYGPQAGVTHFHAAGTMEFIPLGRRRGESQARELGRELALVSLYEPGTRIDLTQPRSPFIYSGWYAPESNERWFEQDVVVRFRLEKLQALRLRMWGHTYGEQRIIVTLNGQVLKTLTDAGGPLHAIEVDLPSDHLRGSNILELKLPDAQLSRKMKANDDSRVLGIGLSWIELVPAETLKP